MSRTKQTKVYRSECSYRNQLLYYYANAVHKWQCTTDHADKSQLLTNFDQNLHSLSTLLLVKKKRSIWISKREVMRYWPCYVLTFMRIERWNFYTPGYEYDLWNDANTPRILTAFTSTFVLFHFIHSTMSLCGLAIIVLCVITILCKFIVWLNFDFKYLK